MIRGLKGRKTSQRLNDAGFHFVQATVVRLLATLERVFVLSESQLILKFVFFKLVLDILCDLFGIFTYCVYLVTSAPKRSVAVLVFQICMPLMYEQTAFSFEKSHEA